jgi:8-oxo-dGTP pyrophosphatase MutT (NUDIX family)
MMIEVCAGLLEKDDPLTCIVKEAEEETGYAISNPKRCLKFTLLLEQFRKKSIISSLNILLK